MASYWAIGTYYLVGIPLASIFAFACDFGALSFQASFVPVVIIMCVAFTWILHSQDWQEIADQVAKRIENEANQIANRELVSSEKDQVYDDTDDFKRAD